MILVVLFVINFRLCCSFCPPCSLNTKDPEPKSQWKLCFKLYCLLDTESISVDSIEYLFLFEQVMKQNTDVGVFSRALRP